MERRDDAPWPNAIAEQRGECEDACEEVVVPEMAEALLQARNLRELRVVDDRFATLLGECRHRRRWSEELVDGDDEAPENAERRAQIECLLKRGPRLFVEVGVAGEEQVAPGPHRLAVVPLSAVFARAPALLRPTAGN